MSTPETGVFKRGVPRIPRKLCHARSKRTGERCGAVVMRDREVCYHHGGKTLQGLANPNYKHGRYSKHLPAQMLSAYHEALHNPRLLSLNDDIAVAEARLAERLEAVSQGDSAATWQALRTAVETFQDGMARGDVAVTQAQFAVIERLVLRGTQTAAAWEEIQALWLARCKLIQTEMKTLQGMQQMITVQQHLLMLGAQTDVVVKAVQAHADVRTGRKILQEIQVEFQRLATLEERR